MRQNRIMYVHQDWRNDPDASTSQCRLVEDGFSRSDRNVDTEPDRQEEMGGVQESERVGA